MGDLWHNEKRARLALGAGLLPPPPPRLLPLLLLLLLPMLPLIGAKGTTPHIQAVRPPSTTRNDNADHNIRQHSYPLRAALSTHPLDESERSDDVPSAFATRFVFEGDLNWLDELSTTQQQASLPAAAAAAAAATTATATASTLVRDSDLPRQSDRHQRQRGMQAVCSPGDAFSLISTVHAEAGGCYFQGADDTNAYFTADEDRIVLPASISASSSTTETFAWVAGKVLGFSGGALDVDPECVSDEPWDVNSHPMDAGSWSCLVGGTLVAFSQESFGIECGCSGGSSDTAGGVGTSTPAPASTTDASTPAANPTPSPSLSPSPVAGGLSCDADSVKITSPQLEEFEGCFADTGPGVNGTSSSHFGRASSELGVGGDGGTNAVFAASIDERGHQVRWVAGTYANVSTDSGIVPTCISDDNAAAVHPADSTWLCDLTGTGTFTTVNEMQFRVDCGCSSTSSSSSSDTNSEASTPSQGGDDGSRSIGNPGAPTEGSADSGGSSSSSSSAAAAAGSTPTPSPNSQSAAAIEAGANGGSPTFASGRASSAFGLTVLLAAMVAGLARPFAGE